MTALTMNVLLRTFTTLNCEQVKKKKRAPKVGFARGIESAEDDMDGAPGSCLYESSMSDSVSQPDSEAAVSVSNNNTTDEETAPNTAPAPTSISTHSPSLSSSASASSDMKPLYGNKSGGDGGEDSTHPNSVSRANSIGVSNISEEKSEATADKRTEEENCGSKDKSGVTMALVDKATVDVSSNAEQQQQQRQQQEQQQHNEQASKETSKNIFTSGSPAARTQNEFRSTESASMFNGMSVSLSPKEARGTQSGSGSGGGSGSGSPSGSPSGGDEAHSEMISNSPLKGSKSITGYSTATDGLSSPVSLPSNQVSTSTSTSAPNTTLESAITESTVQSIESRVTAPFSSYGIGSRYMQIQVPPQINASSSGSGSGSVTATWTIEDEDVMESQSPPDHIVGSTSDINGCSDEVLSVSATSKSGTRTETVTNIHTRVVAQTVAEAEVEAGVDEILVDSESVQRAKVIPAIISLMHRNAQISLAE